MEAGISRREPFAVGVVTRCAACVLGRAARSCVCLDSLERRCPTKAFTPWKVLLKSPRRACRGLGKSSEWGGLLRGTARGREGWFPRETCPLAWPPLSLGGRRQCPERWQLSPGLHLPQPGGVSPTRPGQSWPWKEPSRGQRPPAGQRQAHQGAWRVEWGQAQAPDPKLLLG